MYSFDYWYVFPYAVLVAITANASGFSGAVLFQPFFNFILKIPIAQSIATGIATETIGMTSGTIRYYLMKKIDYNALKTVLIPVILGVLSGLYIFLHIGHDYLRLIVGVVISTIAIYQIYRAKFGIFGTKEEANIEKLRKKFFRSFIAGVFSAVTGTGVAEIHQPLFDYEGELNTKKANATAIATEAIADWVITIFNLTFGNLNFNILIFSVSGVIIGAQIGALLSQYISDKILKIVFGCAVLFIGIIYIAMSINKLFFTVT